jgi:hypothetical protein
MKKLLILAVAVFFAVKAVRRLMPSEAGEGGFDVRGTMAERLMERCRRMMEEMPEDFPPKLMMSSLQRIQGQNDELLTLMREQNELLREHLPATQP